MKTNETELEPLEIAIHGSIVPDGARTEEVDGSW